MAFSRANPQSDTAKKEQIITEIFPKSLHIILESRTPYVSSSVESPSPSPPSHRPRDKWFNLTLKGCPAALENIDFWQRSILDPMIIDVILVVQRAINGEPAERDGVRNHMNLESEDSRNETITEKVIERWIVQYEIRKSTGGSSRSKRSCGNLHALYKKSVLLLRSLYATVRLLPAYKLFRELISSSHINNYTLTCRVNSFVEPLMHKEEADMRRFCFTPVDTSSGRLCLSVLYNDTLVSDLKFGTLTPVSPQFIPDYVGSPKVDPFKWFPSPPVSQSRLPSYAYPLPTNSHSKAPASKPSPCPQPMNLPLHRHGKFQANIKPDGFDQNWSPLTVSISRPESAPVGIPATKAPCALVSSNAHLLLPPSPPLKSTKPEEKTGKCPGAGGSVGEKFSLGRDESGRFSGLRSSSSSSPCLSFSRSSSRLSIQDDFDDAGFDCHFVLDEDDMADSGSRPGSSDTRKQPSYPFEPDGSARVRKSQEAAVGALVLMLKRAPPLQHNCTNSTPPSSTFTKATADALMELRTYREMKERFLRQGGIKF